MLAVYGLMNTYLKNFPAYAVEPCLKILLSVNI